MRRTRSFGPITFVALAVGLLALGAAPSQALPARPTGAPAAPTSVSGSISLGGADISNATTPASAFAVTFDHPFSLVFSWNARGGKLGQPASVTVGDARAEWVYFGQAIVTRDEVESTPVSSPNGSINMTWDLTGDRYLVEGVYLFHFRILDPSGAAIWERWVYLRATASYHLTLANIALVALAAVELHAVFSIRAPKPERAPPAKGGS